MDYFFQLCRFGNVHGIEEIIQDISNIDAKNKNSDTPLTLAILSGSYETVEYLLQQGASIDLKNQFNQTPLMHAVDEGNVKIVKLLLRYGADINALDDDGDNALVYATFFCNEFPRYKFKDRYSYIIQVLITHGIDIFVVDKYGVSALANMPDHVQKEIVDFYNSYCIRRQLIHYRIQQRAKNPTRQQIWKEAGLDEFGL